jgi:hypothetical protein
MTFSHPAASLGASGPKGSGGSTPTPKAEKLRIPVESGAPRFQTVGVLPPVYRRETDGTLTEVVPATPCPELLTEDEAVRYLRLDLVDIENPHETLRRYRKQGLVRGTQVGKCIRYRRAELENFLARVTESNPR